MSKWQVRWSPTLGELEDTAENVWGTLPYSWDTEPTCFFGVYGLPDFYAVWRHKGRRHILWAGTDILHLRDNYWLEDGGKIRIDNKGICEWLNRHCVNWCENVAEYEMLKSLGIKSQICPSFLGDVSKFKVSFKPGNKVYASVSGDNFEQYKWDLIEKVAASVPEVDFYLYGSDKWKTKNKNVIIKGRVDKEVMNAEVRQMQAGLRLLDMDGASEIVVKSALFAHHTITKIRYPFIDSYETEEELVALLKEIPNKKEPNLRARDWFLENLNNYPWNAKRLP